VSTRVQGMCIPLLRPSQAPAEKTFPLPSYGHLVRRASDQEKKTGGSPQKENAPRS
jgi:hypothetical protein